VEPVLVLLLFFLMDEPMVSLLVSSKDEPMVSLLVFLLVSLQDDPRAFLTDLSRVS